MPKAGAQSADRTIDLLAFVEVGKEVVAVALEIIADEAGVVAVGDEADAFGKEGFVDLDLFQADRSGLTGHFGKPGDFVHQLTLGHTAHRKREFRAERHAVHDRGKGEPDQRRGRAAAEDEDRRMFADEHVEVAAHQDHQTDDADARSQTQTCRDIHDLPPNATKTRGKTPI